MVVFQTSLITNRIIQNAYNIVFFYLTLVVGLQKIAIQGSRLHNPVVKAYTLNNICKEHFCMASLQDYFSFGFQENKKTINGKFGITIVGEKLLVVEHIRLGSVQKK